MQTIDATAPTTALEEEWLDTQYPWKCYSQNLKVFEEFASLKAMADAKGLSVDVIMDAIASNGGNTDGFHFVKR